MSFKQLLHQYGNFNRRGWHGQTCLSVSNLIKPVIVILGILFSIYAHNGVVARRALPLQDGLSLVSTASAEEPKEIKEKKILYWTCGMHPTVKMDKPGKCPICAMDLVPVYEKGAGAEEGAVSTIELSEHARNLAQVKTDVVIFKTLTKDIYTVGQIEYDERLKAVVSAWIPGRIDKLFIDFTGTEVIKGESMIWLYSPELVSTQEEYLLALETLEKVKESPFSEVVTGAKSLVAASKKRLLWWGLTEKQVDILTKDKNIKQHT